MPVKRVLVIDDEPEILSIIKQRLKANHCMCFTAGSAEEGLEQAFRHQPDIILLDLMLPGMSGLGFLREYARKAGPFHAPVIVVTAIGDEDVAREAMSIGAVGYLRKPYRSEVMISMIHEYANKKPEQNLFLMNSQAAH